MPIIIPSTDLRNKFSEVEELAKESREPIYLTKNGRGTLVLMDIDAFSEHQSERMYRSYIDNALAEATQAREEEGSRYQDVELAFAELLEEPLFAKEEDNAGICRASA